MSSKKAPNPNTAYGRKRLREENAQRFNNLPVAKQAEQRTIIWIVFIVIVLIALIIGFATGHEKETLKWLNR